MASFSGSRAHSRSVSRNITSRSLSACASIGMCCGGGHRVGVPPFAVRAQQLVQHLPDLLAADLVVVRGRDAAQQAAVAAVQALLAAAAVLDDLAGRQQHLLEPVGGGQPVQVSGAAGQPVVDDEEAARPVRAVPPAWTRR